MSSYTAACSLSHMRTDSWLYFRIQSSFFWSECSTVLVSIYLTSLRITVVERYSCPLSPLPSSSPLGAAARSPLSLSWSWALEADGHRFGESRRCCNKPPAIWPRLRCTAICVARVASEEISKRQKWYSSHLLCCSRAKGLGVLCTQFYRCVWKISASSIPLLLIRKNNFRKIQWTVLICFIYLFLRFLLQLYTERDSVSHC